MSPKTEWIVVHDNAHTNYVICAFLVDRVEESLYQFDHNGQRLSGFLIPDIFGHRLITLLGNLAKEEGSNVSYSVFKKVGYRITPFSFDAIGTGKQ